MEGGSYPPHPGTRVYRCRCSLPGLTGFTTYRCGRTGTSHHDHYTVIFRLIGGEVGPTRGYAPRPPGQCRPFNNGFPCSPSLCSVVEPNLTDNRGFDPAFTIFISTGT